MTTVTLRHLDGRDWYSAGFLPGEVCAAWSWVAETCAREHECEPEDVDCVEDPDGAELVTVLGEPVAVYAILYGGR